MWSFTIRTIRLQLSELSWEGVQNGTSTAHRSNKKHCQHFWKKNYNGLDNPGHL
jgi:hypothetical protein